MERPSQATGVVARWAHARADDPGDRRMPHPAHDPGPYRPQQRSQQVRPQPRSVVVGLVRAGARRDVRAGGVPTSR